MSKPKEPMSYEEWQKSWEDYYQRMERYLERKKRDNRLYAIRHIEKERQRKKNWKLRNKDKLRLYMERYRNRPEVRAKEIQRLNRYIENNPFCNLEKIERFIKWNERNYSLDQYRGEKETKLYDLLEINK